MRAEPATQTAHPSVLVCGAGSIGLRHLRNLTTLGISRLAVSEPDDQRRRSAEEEIPCEPFASLPEALDQFHPNTVLICSPTKEHLPQAIAAAGAGAHIFIEKPLSYSPEGIEGLRKEIDERNLVSMVGCNMRFHHGPATVRKLLTEGAIGKPHEAVVYTGSSLPQWRPLQDYRKSYSADPVQGGAILDCIHEIDLALWYFGPAALERAEVQTATPLDLTVDGTADLFLRHQSGVRSRVHLSFMEPEYRRFCTIKGTGGSLEWDINRKCVEVRDRKGNVVASHPEPEGYDMNRMYLEEMRHFLAGVGKREKVYNPVAEAAETLTIALTARSAPPRP
ncbi:MAG: Gfo/Idh/MocA family oxidoreductase [Candidatus Peribacteraceae bacterium]|jgi:predicted dehydrogenase